MATPADGWGIARVMTVTQRQAYAAIYPAHLLENQDSDRMSSHYAARVEQILQEGGCFFVAETSEDEVVGFASGSHLYIADPSKNQVYVYDTFGRFIKSWTTEDTKPSPGLYNPNMHLTLDVQGNVYTLNASNGQVTKYDSQGKLLYSWGNQGTESGQFTNPLGITIDNQGNIFVADSGNDRVEKFKQS